MTLAALDPWVFHFDGSDHHLRLDALSDFLDLLQGHPDLEPLRFLDGAFEEWLWSCCQDGSLPLQDLTGWLAHFRCRDTGPPEPPVAAEVGGESPERRRWQSEVERAIQDDDGPNWRDPVVFVPACQELNWPKVEGETSPARGSNDPILSRARRVIVVIENPSDSQHYLRDFDPWKCGRAWQADGEPVTRDLPRPRASKNLPMHKWINTLQQEENSTAGTNFDRLYFVPPREWDPCAIAKEQWRASPFEHGEKVVEGKGRKAGPKDRRGRIWSWDRAHRSHWDVQHEREDDPRYMNVRPDGLITKRYE